MTKLAGTEPYIINLDEASPEFEEELRHLRAIGLIDHAPTVTIKTFIHGEPRKKDLRQYFGLTESGRQYLKHRDDTRRRAGGQK